MLSSGELNRHVLILQKATTGQSATGSPTHIFSPTVYTFAKIVPKLGTIEDQTAASTVAPIRQYSIGVRYREDIVPAQTRIQIVDESPSRTLEVTSCYDPDGRRKDLTILATEVVA